jgi:hypothetical protein
MGNSTPGLKLCKLIWVKVLSAAIGRSHICNGRGGVVNSRKEPAILRMPLHILCLASVQEAQ